jgi:hypothetical protein
MSLVTIFWIINTSILSDTVPVRQRYATCFIQVLSVADPDKTIPDPGSKGQKNTGSRILNTVLVYVKGLMLPWQGSAMVAILADVPEFPVLVRALLASLLLPKNLSIR